MRVWPRTDPEPKHPEKLQRSAKLCEDPGLGVQGAAAWLC